VTTVDYLFVGFLGGGTWALIWIVTAVWMLEKVDGWWGHRKYRKLEYRRDEPETEPRVGFKG